MNFRAFIAAVLLILICVVVISMSIFAFTMETLERVVCFLFSLMFKASGISFTCSGKENIEPGKSYIYISNHSSILDIPSVKLSLPFNVKFIAKKELFKIPLFGFAMKRVGQIPIDRQNRRKAIESLGIAKQRLKDGFSIWMAPEGTRSTDGNVGKFKKGAFMTARQAEVEIVPVSICGPWRILPRNTRKIVPGRIDVHIHPPIATDSEDILKTAERCRRIISDDIVSWKEKYE